MARSPLLCFIFAIYFYSVLICLLTTTVTLAQFPAGEYVKELNNEIFEAEVKGRPLDGFYLVEFYSPTCGHCRAFGPTYEEIGNSLRGIVPVGRLSVHAYPELTKAYKVKGVPHVALFLPQNEHPIVYQDDRTVKDIVDWVLQALVEFEMPVKEVTPDGVDAFLNAHKKIYPSRYLMINSGNVPVSWNLIHKRVGSKAIFGHLNSNSIGDLSAFKAKYNISQLPAALAHLKSQEVRKSGDVEIITFQGNTFMYDVQVALSDEGAFRSGAPGYEDVDTEGILDLRSPNSDFDSNSDQDVEQAFLAYAVIAFAICACFGFFWGYKNRNRKMKEVAVDLQSVILDVHEIDAELPDVSTQGFSDYTHAYKQLY